MNWFRLKSCIKCHGDLAADHGDWLCLQCGTYYYTGLYQLHPPIDDGPQVSNPGVPEQPENKHIEAAAAPPFPDPQRPAPGSITVAKTVSVAAP